MKRSLCRFFSLFFMLLLMLPGGVMGATNGCDNEENEYISPALALCSTHVYNIGEDENPRSEDMRGYMRDVVALKSTIMTQQLNKQYEYLESMIRRFKTQLEKAVLTTKLQTSGATDSVVSGGGSSATKSDDKYRVLAGTNNCMQKSVPGDVVSCLQSNVRIVMDAVAAGNTTDARKQLEQDLSVAKTWGIIGGSSGSYVQKDSDNKDSGTMLENCNLMQGNRRKEIIADCANELNVQLGMYTYNQNRLSQMQQNKK